MILGRLKEETRERHEALEGLVDVMDRTLSMDAYGGLLTTFYRFYSAVEPRLPAAALLTEGFDVAERRKVPLLERDLEHLKILSTAKDLAPLADIPSVETVARAFGGIYVMEGATLGGQVITRHLREHLGLTPDAGGAFFNSYGKEVGPMWKRFGAAITAFAERNPHAEDQIVDAAKETFDCFRRGFAAEGAGIISSANV